MFHLKEFYKFMEQRVLTVSANQGIGLLTLICRSFTVILGIKSKMYLKKQKLVLENARKRLDEELSALGQGYELTDVRVTWQGASAVTISALAVKGGTRAIATMPVANGKQCPSCGASIDDEMDFCAECGAKLK